MKKKVIPIFNHSTHTYYESYVLNNEEEAFIHYFILIIRKKFKITTHHINLGNDNKRNFLEILQPYIIILHKIFNTISNVSLDYNCSRFPK